MENWLINHWVQIGVIWLGAIKVLTVIQDACDAEPAGLKPPFGKLLYYMSALGQSLIIGNRPLAIKPQGGLNVQADTNVSSSSATTVSKQS